MCETNTILWINYTSVQTFLIKKYFLDKYILLCYIYHPMGNCFRNYGWASMGGVSFLITSMPLASLPELWGQSKQRSIPEEVILLPSEAHSTKTLESDQLGQDPGSASTHCMTLVQQLTFVVYKMGLSTLLTFMGMKWHKCTESIQHCVDTLFLNFLSFP